MTNNRVGRPLRSEIDIWMQLLFGKDKEVPSHSRGEQPFQRHGDAAARRVLADGKVRNFRANVAKSRKQMASLSLAERKRDRTFRTVRAVMNEIF